MRQSTTSIQDKNPQQSRVIGNIPQQNRNCRNEPTTIGSINLQQSMKEYPMGKKTVTSTNGVGKTGQQNAK